ERGREAAQGCRRVARARSSCPWHRRHAPQLLPIHVPPPDPPDPDPVRGEVLRRGDSLPFGVRAFEGFEPNDLVLYVESRRAVVVGDTLIDRGNRLILAELAAVGGGPPSPTTGGGAAAKSLRWPRVCVLQRPSPSASFMYTRASREIAGPVKGTQDLP